MNLFAPILAASPAALARVPAFTAGAVVPRPAVAHATVGGTAGWRVVRPANTAAVRVDPFDLGGETTASPQPAVEVVRNVGRYQPPAFPSDDPTRDLLPFAPTYRGGLFTVVRPVDGEGLDEVVSHPILIVHTEQPAVEDDAPTDTRPVVVVAARSRPAVIRGRTCDALGSQVPAFVVGFHPAAAGVNAGGDGELARAARCGPARVAVSVGGLTPPDPAVLSCGPWAAAEFLPGRRAEVITGGRVGSFAREQVFSGSDFTDSVDDTPMPVGGLAVGVFVG